MVYGGDMSNTVLLHEGAELFTGEQRTIVCDNFAW